MGQLQDGWLLKYHPKMGSFYTYDPENQGDTFGSRGFTKQEVRNMVKKGVLEALGQTNEIFRLKVTQ